MPESNGRSNDITTSDIIITDTNIETVIKDDIATFCRFFKAKIHVNPSSSTTYCVTTTTEHDGVHLATKRTVKLLMAFSERIKLVSSNWITACVIQQRIVDDNEFLVRGLVLGNKIIRFKETGINSQLLKSLKFWVEEKDNDAITYRKLIKLIENCGGLIVEPSKGVLLISMTEKNINGYNNPTVNYKYVLDSLTFQTQLKIENYLLE